MNLDADVYTFASTYASAKGIPLGAAISELLRRAKWVPEPASALLTESRLGLLVRMKQDGEPVVTHEMVKDLSEEPFDKGEVHQQGVDVLLARVVRESDTLIRRDHKRNLATTSPANAAAKWFSQLQVRRNLAQANAYHAKRQPMF